MKNKLIYTGLALAVIAFFTATGCKKETAQIADDSAKYESQLIADDADKSYNEVVVATEGGETTEFSAENEGLPEAYILVETDMDDAGFKRGVERRYFSCLKKLNLTDTQVMQLRKAVRAYEECKAADIKAHRAAYATLVARIEHARQELVTHLRLGKITKAQFEQGIKELRADFVKSLRDIKASYAKTLKACYEKFLRATKEILTERQWKAFVDCYR
jgi:hypothetical protein